MKRMFRFRLKPPTLYTYATVEMSFKNGAFSASGSIPQACCGQCLDVIAKRILPNETFDKIYRLWKLYHLNDIHPECEHQNELGWNNDATTQVVVRTYYRTIETIQKCDEIKNKVLRFAKQRQTYIPTEEEVVFLNLESYKKTYDYILEDSRYELRNCEEKTRGWLTIEETPLGLINKPCPVCGYKYGTKWLKQEIPEKDKDIIINLLKGE